MGIFSSKSKSINLEPMLTDEQKSAQTQLMNLGQLYDLSGFNFNMSPQELKGSSLLNNYLSSGTENLNTAADTLTDIATQTFNPQNPNSGFAAYSRQVAKAGKTASDQLSRNAAITGSRYSTSAGKDQSDLAVQQSDILASKLGQLYQSTQSQRVAAAQGLGQVQELQNQIQNNKIAAAYQYGTRQRDLQNQKAQLAYDEWKRGESERVSGLQSVWNKNVQYGLKSYTQKRPSTFMSMLGEISPAVGSYNTAEYGYTTNQASIKDALSQLAQIYGGQS